MVKNKLRVGLKSNKKLKDSFYHFIVDNRIDWAIILGTNLSVLPYLGSEVWYYILLKSLILIIIILISLQYLKYWNELRNLDNRMKSAVDKLKSGIKEEKIIDTERYLEFQNSFNEKLIQLAKDYKTKSSNYKDFTEYIKYDKEVPIEFNDLLNEDRDLTFSFINLTLGIFLVIEEIRYLPKLRLQNYYRLLAILILTFVFFIIYTVENSI